MPLHILNPTPFHQRFRGMGLRMCSGYSLVSLLFWEVRVCMYRAVPCACVSFPLSFPDCTPQPQTQNGVALASALYPARRWHHLCQFTRNKWVLQWRWCYSMRKVAQELLRLGAIYACQKIFMRKKRKKMTKLNFLAEFFFVLRVLEGAFAGTIVLR